MSNHVHYLIEPAQPGDLPKIMHFLNWYTMMCFNQRLRRTGLFCQKRYYCEGFLASDRERALNTLRYIHGNPKAAKMRYSFFYDFSNYVSYERLTDDGLTLWHPAFLRLGNSLEECARKYKGFCQKSTSPRRRTQASATGEVSYSLLYIFSIKVQLLTPKNPTPVSVPPPCQISEDEELTRVVRQFIAANRAQS